MTEDRLQYQCVKWFNDTHKQLKGRLFEINNKTNKGAYRKGLGLVRGASDLMLFSDYCAVAIELKVDGSRHEIEHLQRQHDWATNINETRYAYALFCFSFEMFKTIVTDFVSESKDVTNKCDQHVTRSCNYINALIVTNNHNVTAKVDYQKWLNSLK